jgi:hypothetical protein
MTEIEASRTLVKSPPELWAECSEASTLARHLGQFGEIKITRLEPESAVAWEGTLASGTVRLEPSGWGTKVILTAQQLEAAAQPEPETTVEPEAFEPRLDAVVPLPSDLGPEASPAPVRAPLLPPAPSPAPVRAPQRSGGLLGRLLGLFRSPQPPEIALDPVPDPPASAAGAMLYPADPVVPEPEPVAVPDIDHEAILAAALDSLGQAHHRPFSR